MSPFCNLWKSYPKIAIDVIYFYRQPEKRSEYQTLVLNYRPFGNALAVFFFRRRARLRSCAHYFHYSIQKRCGKLGRYVSFNEIHGLYDVPNFGRFRWCCTNYHVYNQHFSLYKRCTFNMEHDSQCQVKDLKWNSGHSWQPFYWIFQPSSFYRIIATDL